MAPEDKTMDLNEDMQAIKDDLNKLQSDLRGIAQSLMGMGKQSARQAREAVGSKVESGTDVLQEYVEKRPVVTILVAFVVGMLAGKLFGRG